MLLDLLAAELLDLPEAVALDDGAEGLAAELLEPPDALDLLAAELLGALGSELIALAALEELLSAEPFDLELAALEKPLLAELLDLLKGEALDCELDDADELEALDLLADGLLAAALDARDDVVLDALEAFPLSACVAALLRDAPSALFSSPPDFAF